MVREEFLDKYHLIKLIMARFSRIEVCSKMIETGIVPVFYHSDIEISKQVIKACYKGGIRVFEFTNRGDFAHDFFGELIKWSTKECPKMILGIGSIIDAGTASLFIQLGANFVVGPLLNADVAKVCNRRQVPYIPGCGSVTEIGNAQELGAEVVKIFPAGNVGGPSFVKNIMAPMPWSRIMATGAVEPTEENLKGWFSSGVACVGMGSKLFPKEIIETQDWEYITQLSSKALEIVKNTRK